MFLHDEHQV
ncbi:UNVERIFIED_CONTAM: hypothetical protein GTU68_065897 [Idotea baltica]|nr:hypothetical protein [Idotea baltica]